MKPIFHLFGRRGGVHGAGIARKLERESGAPGFSKLSAR